MDFTRQLGIIDPIRLPPVILIGAGGIGSPTALALCKMGIPYLDIFDNDVVEPHNQPTTLYRHNQMMSKKVDAIKEILMEQTVTEVGAWPIKVGKRHALSGVVVSGVDSMSARTAILEAVLASKEDVVLYLEARMAGEVGIIHSLDPKNEEEVEQYRSHLFSDAEADPQTCTERGIIYNVFVIAGLITALVKRFAMNQPIPIETDIDLVNFLLVTGDTRIVGLS